MMKFFAKLLPAMKQEKGQGLLEYCLIISLVAIVVIVALTSMRGGLADVFDRITALIGTEV